MTRPRSAFLVVVAALASALFLLGTACGGSSNNSAKVSAGPSGAATAAGAQALAETTTDNKFSAGQLTAKAGQPVTLTVDNKGTAVHNWHLTTVKYDDGKDVKSALIDGGKSSTVTFTIAKAGTYKFNCEAHPDDMTGTLVVQ